MLFRSITANNIRAKLEDNSYIQAEQLYKNLDKAYITKGNYTSCTLCKNGKARTPQWQIYANKILYDEKKQNIYFTHSFLKIYKMPVLYLPKMSFPGPKVKKRSGILPIKYAYDKLLHNQISVPIFLNLSPNYDLTYTPTIFSKQNIFHEAEARYLNKSGTAYLSGGYVKENTLFKEYLTAKNFNPEDEDQRKWYLNLKYLFNVNDFGFEGDIFDASGRAMLERYKYDFQQYFTSDINANYLKNDKFFLFNIGKFYNFADNHKIYEFPHISYRNTKKLNANSFYKYDLDYTYLNAPDTIHRQRFFYKDSLYKNFVSNNGLLLNTSLNNTIRAYYHDDANVNNSLNTH